MSTTKVYEQLLAEITDTLERKVFQVLAEVPGERVTRPELVLRVFGIPVAQGSLGSNPEDRKIRKCIERLQGRGFPILASSGEAGYWMETDPTEIETYIAELESRRERMAEKIRSLRRAKGVASQINWKAKPQPASQITMF